jgi:hypothetical protein
MNAMEDNGLGAVIPPNDQADEEQGEDYEVDDNGLRAVVQPNDQGDEEPGEDYEVDEFVLILKQAFEGGPLEGAAGVAAKGWGLAKNWLKPKVGGADEVKNVRMLDTHPGNDIWPSLWIYGDDFLESILTAALMVAWMVELLIGGTFLGKYRPVMFIATAFTGELMMNQMKRIPYYMVSRAVENGRRVRRSTIDWTSALAITVSGSIFSKHGRKLRYMLVSFILAHSVELLTGSTLSTDKFGAGLGAKSIRADFAPIGGGQQEDGRYFFMSGLKYLADDREEIDGTIMAQHGGEMLVIRHVQQAYAERPLRYYRAEAVNGFVLSTGSKIINGTRVECEGLGTAETNWMAIEQGYDGDADLSFTFEFKAGTTKGVLDSLPATTKKLTEAVISYSMVRHDYGPKITKIHDVRDKKPFRGLEFRKEDMKATCQGFVNVLAYGLKRNDKTLQANRVAVALLIRSASRGSKTGYSIKGQTEGKGAFGELRYGFPDWVNILLIITGIVFWLLYFEFVIRPPVLPRSLESVAVHLGPVLARNTNKCATRDVKVERRQKESTNDFTLEFGYPRSTVPGLHAGRQTRVRRVRTSDERDLRVVHLEWGLSGEILRSGKPSRSMPKGLYAGCAGQDKRKAGIAISTEDIETETSDRSLRQEA